MKRIINEYKSPEGKMPVKRFIDGLEQKLRQKIKFQLVLISNDAGALGMPHIKAFRIEKNKGIFELRTKMKRLTRILFYFDREGNIVLLHGFLKNHAHSTEQALDIARQRMAEIKAGLAETVAYHGETKCLEVHK